MRRFRVLPPVLFALVPSLLAPSTRAAKNDLALSSNSSVPVASLASPRRSAAPSSANKPSVDKSATGLSSLPADAQGPISGALGKNDSGYWFHPTANGLSGENPRHALRAELTKQGTEIRHHNLRWVLAARGYGYGDALRRFRPVAPQANANRVEYRRDGTTEWYENGPLGLEQGFTLAHPPGKAKGQALTVELAIHGDLVAVVGPGRKTLELSTKDGEAALRYTGLKARDATGRDLRSWIEMRGDRLLVRVDDGGARYPVVVDPWIQQAELSASDGTSADFFGWSVAMSGNTLVVGANHPFSSSPGQGTAYVFVQSGGIWVQQAELTPSDGEPSDEFGRSVALDGSTLVVGAPFHPVSLGQGDQGAAYVFVQNGTTWSQQAELLASDGQEGDLFGFSVVVRGNTAVVGARYHPAGSGPGAAYVFVQNGTTWSQQAELTASDGVANDGFATSVALDGTTAVFGAPYHSFSSSSGNGPGAAYIFVQNGTTWSQQAELTASDSVAYDGFGYSVALEGSTALFGAACHPASATSCGPGAAYVFVENRGTWTQQQELEASEGVAHDGFGTSVALDGSTAVFGAPGHAGHGAAYVFAESGGTWSQQTELTASDGTAGGSFGLAIAVNSSSTVLVGAPYNNVGANKDVGAAYVFGSSGPLYTLSASPGSLSVVTGGQATSTLTITPWNGFSGSVAFSASELPNGVTAAFNPNPATSNTTMTLTAKGTATAGTATMLVIGASGNLTQTATLQLTVTAVALATLSPTSLSFDDQALDTTGAAKTVTLKNTGAFAVDISSIAFALGTNFAISSGTCGSTLAVGKTCKMSVTFTPTQLGKRTDTLTFTDSASNSPQTVVLSGTGEAQTTLTPSSHTFPKTKVGDTSAAYTFTLRNNLPTALTGISYSTASPFAVSTTTCETTLDSKKSCTISVMFTPGSEETFTGALTVTDSASNSPQVASLSGTGD
jgi:FG-GAP repeat/Abnormal spindle-like microcephaly-assoc'd, ASPM-SPD-2-Hydin